MSQGRDVESQLDLEGGLRSSLLYAGSCIKCGL